MKIKTEDKIVQQVLRKMDERSLIGQKKYGATIMDALLYIEAARRCLTDEVEEVMLKRTKVYEENI
jgi:hypothetical protein